MLRSRLYVARWLMADVMDSIDVADVATLCAALRVQPADLLVLRDVPPPTTADTQANGGVFARGPSDDQAAGA